MPCYLSKLGNLYDLWWHITTLRGRRLGLGQVGGRQSVPANSCWNESVMVAIR